MQGAAGCIEIISCEGQTNLSTPFRKFFFFQPYQGGFHNLISALSKKFVDLSAWWKYAILVAMVLTASIWYLWPSYIEFPMDDAYIHMVYAQNLVKHGQLFFNHVGEIGVGTTSILWVLLLAAGHKLGFSLSLLAKILGMTSLATVGIGLYKLLCGFWHSSLAFAAALIIVLSGNMLWFSLSGMETTLFLALAILALLSYREEQWGWLGITLGLLVLTRPEGLMLAVTIGFIEVLRQKGLRRGIVIAGLVCILICGPWIGYLLWRTNNVLPTSGMGKHFSTSIALQYALQKNGIYPFLGRFSALLYICLWVVYLLEFTLGGMSLPPPTIPIGNIVGNVNYTMSIWSIPAWGMVICWLTVGARKFFASFTWRRWIQDSARRPMVALLGWGILHNLSYMVFLPIPGTASRYGAINHIILWLVLFYGLLSFVKNRKLFQGLVIGFIVIFVANTIFWNHVYDANLDHMKNVRIPAAIFIRDNFRPDKLCGANDIGALRYHSGRPIFDLGGLIDPNADKWFQRIEFDKYILKNEVDCLALPGRSGTDQEGWLDIAEILGLTTSSLFKMDQVAIFEIEYERWMEGYLPTSNYQASVVIYRLLPTGLVITEIP